ncbi:MAG: GatB/YqeY domain-containing protein [bacterium]|nr:GatB/YqeY domain-containing protein [bacterium]
MDLRKRLAEDTKSALKAQDKERLSVLRMVQSDIRYEELKEKEPLDESAVISVLSRWAKQRKDSIAQFKKGGRDDLVRKEEKELKIIEAYLPKQLSAAELEEVVQRAIDETGATSMKEMGAVMKQVMAVVADQADGKAVSEIVRRFLS